MKARPATRTTRQRSAIRDALQASSPFRTAQEVHALMSERGVGVGLTTVYRTLQAFEADGLLDVVANDQGEAMYRWCGAADHHHHIVCRSCGVAAEIRGRAIERWVKESAEEHGFSAVSHTAEIFGLCRNCS